MVMALALALATASAIPGLDPVPPTITTDMLVEAADISGLALSPDGKWLAYRTIRGSLTADRMLVDWYVVPTRKGGVPIYLGSGGEVLFTHAGGILNEPPVWAGDSRTLVFRARMNGSVQLWSVSIGRQPTPLTADPADIVDFSMRSDGRTLDYRTGATRAAIRTAAKTIYDEGMLVDGTTDLAQPVAGGLVVDGERVMQRYTGEWFDRAPLLNDTKLTTHTITLTDVTPAPGRTAAAHGSPTIRFVRKPSDSILSIDRINGSSATCPTIACGKAPISAVWVADLDAIVTSSENSKVVDPVDSLGRTRLRLWKMGSRTGKLILDQPGTLTGGTAPSAPCPVSGSTMFCVAEAAASPAKLVAIDVRTGRQQVIDDPNAALRHAITSPVRPLDWTADGHKYHGELLVPDAPRGPVPLVISYYTSRGFLRGGFGEAFPIQPLLKAGIAVLCIDKSRLPDPYNAERNYDVARVGILAITEQLIGEKIVDRGRIGMWGYSFGSEVTSRMVHKTRLLKAAALASVQVTESYYWSNAMPGRDMQKLQLEQFGVDWPDRAPATWAKIAPSRNTATLSAPMLLQLPEDEARWMGEFLSSALRDGKPAEMHAFADEAHTLMGPRHKRAALTRNLDWFRYWLNDERDPDPDKAAQYRRWDALSAMNAAKPLDRANP